VGELYTGEQHEDARPGLSPGGAAHHPFAHRPSPAHSLPQCPPLSLLVAPATVAGRPRGVDVAMETENPGEIRRRQHCLSQHDGVMESYSVSAYGGA